MKREFQFKEAVLSDPSYGKYPGAHTMEEVTERGIVVLDKPEGPTSHQATGWVKDILGLSKAGHSGTLDPRATGVLLIALGKATKTMPVLSNLDKEYVSLVMLHGEVSDGELETALEQFRGKIKQTPPKKSAVKREERVREVKELELLERGENKILLRVKCEAGTYIRKLAHDLGEELGCGAHMKELRRTAVGPFDEEEAVKLQTLKDDRVFYEEGENENIRGDILPLEMVADVSSCIVVKDTAVEALCNGADLGVGGISAVERSLNKGDKVSLLTGKGELVAIGKAEMGPKDIYESNRGKAVSLINVLMERGTYPKAWK
ncbi:MAG: RNA-guided pseudouridylation complex pseudouridine synthase subunit Cbf5 [Candidatus Aenigmatarchaeota archaeon]